VKVEGNWDVLLCDDTNNVCGSMERCTAGCKVDFFIRPERIRMVVNREEASGNNVYKGKVVFLTYLGAQVMYLVEMEGGTILKVSKPTPTGVADFQVGNIVYLSWNSDQIVCLKCYES
jgi:hypothetical protein